MDRRATWAHAWLVAREELRAAYRDRQMVVYAVLLPIGLYPALFWLMLQGQLVVRGWSESATARVLAAAAEPGEGLATFLHGEYAGLEISSTPASADEDRARTLLAAEGSRPDAILASSAAEEGPLRIYFDSTTRSGSRAAGRLEAALDEFGRERRRAAAAALEHTSDDLVPLAIESRNIADERNMGAFVLSLLLPLMLVVMTVLGAFFPAVDATAGECERGTRETTLLLPVPRSAVHLGKIIAVAVAAFLACVLNVLAIGLSAGQLLTQLGADDFAIEMPFGALLAALPLVAAFAFFVATVLVSIASLATSFKEGQALLGPVQLVFFLPSFAAAVPGLAFDVRTACVPVVNVVLAFRDLLRGEARPLPLLVCALVLTLLGAAAVRLSLTLAGREALLLPGRGFSLRDLPRLFRGAGGRA